MKVKAHQLKEGCILSADVIGLSNKPIIQKKTIITKEYLDIIRVFLIDSVEIEPVLVTGEKYIPQNQLEQPEMDEKKADIDSYQQQPMQQDFLSLYLQAVKQYKKLFGSWQSGAMIDMLSMRNMILPFIEKDNLSSKHVFSMHHYSTAAEYIYHHPVSVSILSAFLAKKMNYSIGDIIQIALAGLLIDCGMAKLTPSLLDKKGPLTENEFEEVKQHPVYSYKMLKQQTAFSESARLAVIQHHERMNGTGYPFAITGEKIHPYSKIVSVADVFHAMTSERIYRKKQSAFKVLETIIHDHFGEFDHQVIQALISGVANMSIGTKIRLSNNEFAEIVYIDSRIPTRPMIKLQGTDEIIQLSEHSNLFIDEVL